MERESYFAEQENFANKYIGFTVGSIIVGFEKEIVKKSEPRGRVSDSVTIVYITV